MMNVVFVMVNGIDEGACDCDGNVYLGCGCDDRGMDLCMVVLMNVHHFG